MSDLRKASMSVHRGGPADGVAFLRRSDGELVNFVIVAGDWSRAPVDIQDRTLYEPIPAWLDLAPLRSTALQFTALTLPDRLPEVQEVIKQYAPNQQLRVIFGPNSRRFDYFHLETLHKGLRQWALERDIVLLEDDA